MQLQEAALLHRLSKSLARASSCVIRMGDEGGAYVIHVDGELDRFDCPRLDQALTDAERSLATLVVVDCDELEFIDAAGLHSLFDASLRSLARGDHLRITRGTRSVARVFKVSGLEAVLPLIGGPDGV